MATNPCPIKIDCDCTDFPITNYSSEGAEQVPNFYALVFPRSWDAFGCLSLCESEVSQDAADLCALAQEASCETTKRSLEYCNTAQSCSCTSVNGSEFFHTTPAGTFCAETQEACDALAYSYACEHCGDSSTSTVLGEIDTTSCYGEAYYVKIPASGVTPSLWTIYQGSLPTGLSLQPATGIISGTTTSAGTFSFTIRAYNSDGNFAVRTYTIYVAQIITAALTDATTGTPYSLQLQAAGGSGTYVWSIYAGSLPAGLTLSSTGLISGTPTAAGDFSITVKVQTEEA